MDSTEQPAPRRPVPAPPAHCASPRPPACGWGCAPRGRRSSFSTVVLARPPLEAVTGPEQLAPQVLTAAEVTERVRAAMEPVCTRKPRVA
jgi:hypothetical protein